MTNQSMIEWHESLCIEQNPGSCLFLIFGASGDLARRKLFPSLFSLYARGLVGEKTRILGCARKEHTDESFRETLAEFLPDAPSEQIEGFLNLIHYQVLDYGTGETYRNLALRIQEFSQSAGQDLPCIFYLAVPSMLYLPIVRNLSENGFLKEENARSWRHVVFEKPFGHDLESAIELSSSLGKYLREKQIYRIDHYLGKETVQNIFLLRFANLIFEPIWNHQYIDHVQITASETLGVEKRAGYFDQSGLLRDMFQNHLLEMLSLTAMECPTTFEADAVRDEKLKLIRSIRPLTAGHRYLHDIIRAQYQGYLQEPQIPENSVTETYVAIKMFIDNWRWHGVPFYLRAGKKLSERKSEIVIAFKSVPHSIFANIKPEYLQQDILRLRVQPEEGMGLTIQAKKPGPKLCMGALTLNYNYSQAGTQGLDAYARLLLDCQLGDQTLFIRDDIIRASWELYQPLLDSWAKTPENCPLCTYRPGTHGPVQADELLIRENHRWL